METDTVLAQQGEPPSASLYFSVLFGLRVLGLSEMGPTSPVLCDAHLEQTTMKPIFLQWWEWLTLYGNCLNKLEWTRPYSLQIFENWTVKSEQTLAPTLNLWIKEPCAWNQDICAKVQLCRQGKPKYWFCFEMRDPSAFWCYVMFLIPFFILHTWVTLSRYSWKQFKKVLKLRSGLCQGLKLLENFLIIEILECDQFDTCVHNDMSMFAFCSSVIAQKMWAGWNCFFQMLYRMFYLV